VREVLAIARAGFVDRAGCAVQEGAAAFVVPLQDEAFLLGQVAVVRYESFRGKTEEFGQTLDIAIHQPDRGDLAAVGALRTVNVLLDLLGKLAQPPLDEDMPLHVFAQAFVFAAFLLAEPLDLYQVRDHA